MRRGSLVAEVKKELRDFRGVEEKEEDFIVQTPNRCLLLWNDFRHGADRSDRNCRHFLLVGGINIMNSMYTSVLGKEPKRLE